MSGQVKSVCTSASVRWRESWVSRRRRRSNGCGQYCVLLRACALQNGNRPLHRAAECGHGDSVRLLVELGAGVNLSNHVSLRRAITLD